MESVGKVKATRTYTLRNVMDETITELYVYPTKTANAVKILQAMTLNPVNPFV